MKSDSMSALAVTQDIQPLGASRARITYHDNYDFMEQKTEENKFMEINNWCVFDHSQDPIEVKSSSVSKPHNKWCKWGLLSSYTLIIENNARIGFHCLSWRYSSQRPAPSACASHWVNLRSKVKIYLIFWLFSSSEWCAWLYIIYCCIRKDMRKQVTNITSNEYRLWHQQKLRF